MEDRGTKILATLGGYALDEAFFEFLASKYAFQRVPVDEKFLKNIRYLDSCIVLLDLTLPENRGREILKLLRETNEAVDVITLTSEKKMAEAIEVIQMGALDYLHPQKDLSRLFSLLDKALASHSRDAERLSADTKSNHFEEKDLYFGKSAKIKEILQTIDQIASLPTTVLLHGESGTGKEVIARLIHKKSSRADKPLVTVNLPSIPKNLVESVLFGHEKGSFTSACRRHQGKFEIADGGTIFLDEIGELHFELQSKLLRVIQEGEIERVGGSHPIKVNVRLIAATKKDLKAEVKKREFRDDLFYRLNVIPIILPPLRKRKEDIPGLCSLFIDQYSAQLSKKVKAISEDALKTLRAYRWPGNVRELENVIERILALIDPKKQEISIDDIPLEYVFANFSDSTPNARDLDEALVNYEKNLILKALRQNNWNRKQTAKALGITYGILKYKVRKFSIKVPGRVNPNPDPISPFSSKTQ